MPTKPAKKTDDRERAKRLIIEIIRINGGSFNKKTNLYKAFYHAHLRYAEKNSGYLSKWPIVRMPHGPGIHRADELISELVSEGLLQVEDLGEFEGFSFALTDKAQMLSEMGALDVKAIKYGVKLVTGKSANQNSHESHIKSRSWRDADNGDELNIYADISDDETFRRRSKMFRRLSPIIDEVFGG